MKKRELLNYAVAGCLPLTTLALAKWTPLGLPWSALLMTVIVGQFWLGLFVLKAWRHRNAVD